MMLRIVFLQPLWMRPAWMMHQQINILNRHWWAENWLSSLLNREILLIKLWMLESN